MTTIKKLCGKIEMLLRDANQLNRQTQLDDFIFNEVEHKDK